MASKKRWFYVTLERTRTVRVYAEDDDEAKDKAEAKDMRYMAISVWEEEKK